MAARDLRSQTIRRRESDQFGKAMRPMTRENIFGVNTAKLWVLERVRNEFEALRYIRQYTTIRVPEPLQWRQTDDGYYTLFCRDEATRKWQKYYRDVVRPQVSALNSCTTGFNGIVISPPWITEHDRRPDRPVKTADEPIFFFCHGDMAYHNVICDPFTREVVAVCDWENAGFYPK